MKKEISPIILWIVVGVALVGAIAYFVFGNPGGGSSGPDTTLQEKQAEIQGQLTDQQTGRPTGQTSAPVPVQGDRTGESAARAAHSPGN